MSEETPERCPECLAYRGLHAINCNRNSPEQWKEKALQYHKLWMESHKPQQTWYQRNTDEVIRMRKRVTFWQGKWAILKL